MTAALQHPSPAPWLGFEAGCLACGAMLGVTATGNPNRREAVAAMQCVNPQCRRLHACRVYLSMEER